ncbi:hypothetical protein [Actinomadura sp. KC216]|nr:hypothetical protein [Actinomadura sp. KC216]
MTDDDGTLKRIALEEALSLPGMGSEAGGMVGNPHYGFEPSGLGKR